jgi:serine/threonine protein kinase
VSAEPGEGRGTLPLELADQIDRICDRFEATRTVGGCPRIEEYLGEVGAEGRSALLRELLASELEWRRRQGEVPDPAEYEARFPGEAALIAAFFDAADARMIRTTPAGPDAEPLRPGGEPLPGYRLIRYLGGGGFGQVWMAEAPGGLPVALKFVRLAGCQGETELRALETIRGIRHPNLLALFGAWPVGDHLIIGMELADGTLMDRLNQARAQGRPGIPGAELIEYLAEAAKGIDFLNEHIHAPDGRSRVGVQHRDIKPQNILLVGGGVKVADFGLARLLERSATGHTGSLTPSYAAPEFFHHRTSDRSDQYSLAITYCLLRGGRLPFTGPPATVMAGHLHGTPDLEMLPKPERPIVARALAKEPEGRWPNCRALVAALRAALPTEPPPRRRIHRASAAALSVLPVIVGLAAWRFGPWTISPPSPRPVPRATQTPPTTQAPPSEPIPIVVRSSRVDGPRPATPRAEGAPDLRAAAFVRDGDDAYDAGLYAEAVEAYSEALLLDPASAVAANNRGNAYYKLGHHDAAIEDYSRAVRLGPDEPRAYFNRGNAYYAAGQYDEAIGDFTAAVRLDPDQAAAYFNRGLAHRKLGHGPLAEADFAEAARARDRSGASSPP